MYNSVLFNLTIILLLFVDGRFTPIEFVTLKDGSEGLIIYESYEKKYKILDPFLPSDAIDITNIIDNHKNIVITKSNRKLSIAENNVHVTDGLNKNTFRQMLNKTTYHSNIYTYPIFKAIQDMIKGIEDLPDDRSEECCDFLSPLISTQSSSLFSRIKRKSSPFANLILLSSGKSHVL